jgi:hypothetical protein
MVARKVIEVGATGVNEPREIAEMAVARIKLPRLAPSSFRERGEAAPGAGG